MVAIGNPHADIGYSTTASRQLLAFALIAGQQSIDAHQWTIATLFFLVI